MRHLVPFTLLAALIAAGCAAPAADTPPEPAAPAPSEPRPGSNPPAAAPSESGYEPLWAPGDWWKWEVSSDAYGAFEVTTVVADVDGSTYRIGVTDLDAGLRAVWFHVPPMGIVEEHGVAWEMHDAAARLVDLPLADGKTWRGTVEGETVAFAATARGAVFDVVGAYESERVAATFTWSPAARMFERVAMHYGSETPWSSARLLDYGSGHTAPVHLILADDALLGGAGLPLAPAPPEVFGVPSSATHVVMGCHLRGGPALLSIRFLPPDDSPPFVCEHHALGVERTGAMHVLTSPAVAGDWDVLYAPLGPGSVSTEVSTVTATQVVPATAPEPR